LAATNNLSLSCIALATASRTSECYDDVIYVVNFAAWNANSDTVLQTNIPNRYTVCKSWNINVETVGKLCTVSVAKEITHPNGFKVNASKNDAPYIIFGNNGADSSGRQLEIGTSTVSAVPNNFPTKKNQVTVTVQNC
jgi:hypothetical protein